MTLGTDLSICTSHSCQILIFLFRSTDPFPSYQASRQFQYSKFRNEPGSDRQFSNTASPSSGRHASPSSHRRKTSPPTSISSDFHSHSIGSHTKIHRKESNKVVDDKPLIDLSDETDNTEANANKPTTPSEISSLFDTLLSDTSTHYGNVDLGKPLIRETGSAPDPFELNPVYSKPARPQELPGQAKPKPNPPSRPKPIVYRRTTSTESQQSSEGSQSMSPPKSGSTKSLPAEISKKKKHSLDSKSSLSGVSAAKEAEMSALSSSPKKTPLARTSSHSEDKSKFTKAILEEIFSKSKHSTHLTTPTQSALVSPIHQPYVSHNKQRQDKAFDWLNDHLSNFSLDKKVKSGSDPALSNTFPRYDEVPREDLPMSSPHVRPKVYKPATSKQKQPPAYDQVPNEGVSNQSLNNSNQRQPPRYDEVPRFEDPQDVKLPLPKDIYVPQSTVSSYADWDDFDSDFDEDENDNNSAIAPSSTAAPERPSPPPLPPRDYNKDDKHPKPHILPICQDGRQLSHTHYFLIPPKGEKQHPGDKNMAEVRPFSIDGSQLSPRTQKSSSFINYQNLTVKPREESMDPNNRNSHSAEELFVERDSRPGDQAWHGGGAEIDLTQSYPATVHHRAAVGYQRSQSHSPRSLGIHPGYLQEKVAVLQKKVLGVTDEECHAALCHCNWDVVKSVKHLKTEQLFRLGLATREDCWKLLEAVKWNLELASSVMLDQYRSTHGISMESAV